MGSKINLGSLGILQKRAGFVSFQRHTVLVLLSYTVAVCQLCQSSDTMLHSSSVNTSKTFISNMPWPSLTKLGTKLPLAPPKQWPWGQRPRMESLGSKRSFSTKHVISPSDYRVWPWDSCIFIGKIPYTKVIGLKNSPGVIWGHRGQKVIFTKNATSPTVYRVWSCDSCTCISLTPLYKSYGSKNSPGVIWVTGVKRLFSLKTLLLLQITG